MPLRVTDSHSDTDRNALQPTDPVGADFNTKGFASQAIEAIVAAWQVGAISRDTTTELFRRGEVLREGRTTEEEEKLIGAGAPGRSSVTL